MFFYIADVCIIILTTIRINIYKRSKKQQIV